DRLIWHQSQHGVYSTTSRYELALQLRKTRPKIDVSEFDESIWWSIWILPLQLKLKFFVSRFLHRIVPTPEALNSKEIKLLPSCLVCLFAEESI
ncbi:hypothetical protein LINPERPRIM_LOCUS28089, partial [Linum perenne]